MRRRSFISLVGVGSLLRMRLWGHDGAGATARAWGPPVLRTARGEHQRVVLSFTPVIGATSYQVRWQAADASTSTIEGVIVTDYTVHGLRNGSQYWFSVAAQGPSGTTSFSTEVVAAPTAEMNWESLAEAFSGSNPTRSSCPFLMVTGNESDEELRQFMEVVYRFGFEGVTLHPYDFRGFLEEGMWHRWRVVLDHARKLGLVVWQQDDEDYPSGYAGGKIAAKDRRLARWELTLPYRERHRGPKSLSLDLRSVLPSHGNLVSLSAFGPGERVEDLTDRVVDGQAQWEVPEGGWEIFATAAWQPGLEDPTPRYPDVVRGIVRGYIDPLSPAATDQYIETIFEATRRELGAEFGRLWKGWFIDEPGFYSTAFNFGEIGKGYLFTPDFLTRFERRYGYSLRPCLPLLWVAGNPKASAVRQDYADFVSTEFNRLFLGKIRQYCEAHNTQMAGHVLEAHHYRFGPGTGSNFRSLEAFSVPGFDNIFDLWYTPDEDTYWRQPKMASSVSHYQQTPLDEAVVEHFAATGWRTGLSEMKAMIDWTTCRGMNRVVPCGFMTKDPPVWETTPELWLHGKNPLAPFHAGYQRAVNRETMMIRGGRHVAKALVLDNAEAVWVDTAASPWGETTAEVLWKADKALSQAHFDYDNVSCTVFTDAKRCRIEGKTIYLGKEEYEFVVLPGGDVIPVEVLRPLLQFYEAGGTVIMLGPGVRIGSFDSADSEKEILPRLPLRSADGRHDDEVKDLVARLWGTRASGRGRAHLTTYKDITTLLYSFDAHDVWIDPNLEMLQYYHRRLAGRDLYFFNNEGEAVHTTVHLRAGKGVPEFWDPVNGSIRQAPCYVADDRGVQVRLDLERYESVFVVLNPSARPGPHLVTTDADEVLRAGRGQIILRKCSPGPIHCTGMRPGGAMEEKRLVGEAKRLSALTLEEGWTRTVTEGNGAIYRTNFDWPGDAAMTAALVIEGMSQVIRVKLNGKDLGLRFSYPFRFDLGAALRPGRNALELEHIERYTFTSKLGTIRIVPYQALEI